MFGSVFDTIAEESLEFSQAGSETLYKTSLYEPNSEFLPKLVELCSIYATSKTEILGVELSQILHLALQNPDIGTVIVALQGDVVQTLLNILQEMINNGIFAKPKHARRALRMLIKLAASSGLLPQDLYVSGIVLEDPCNPTCLGGFSDVFQAKYRGEQIALKRLRIYTTGSQKESLIQRFNREALVWRQLKHPFILQFLGIDSVTFKEFPCMASFWMENGSLKDYVQDNRDQGQHRVRLLWETAVAMGYLHDFGVVHGDIRAANVFISLDEHVQLADFGLTSIGDTMTTAAATATSECSSIRWTAPEFFAPTDYGFQGPRRTRATDVYAYGGLCLEVLTGRVPFAHLSQDHPVLFKIAAGVKPPADWSLTSSYGASPPLCSFIETCWCANASDRPTITAIIKTFQAQLEDRIFELEEQERGALLSSASGSIYNHARKRPSNVTMDETAREAKRNRASARGVDTPRVFNSSAAIPNKLVDSLRAFENSSKEERLDVDPMYTFVHDSAVRCIKFSTDGKYLATGSNHVAQIFDVRSGSRICLLLDDNTPKGEDMYILTVCFSPDGKYLATGAEDNYIRIWDVARKKLIKIFVGHKSAVTSLDCSRDGWFIVSGSEDKTVRVWDMLMSSSIPRKVLSIGEPESNDGVTSVAVSPNGKLIAAGTLSASVWLWDSETGVPVKRLKGHSSSVYSVAFTPNGNGLVSGSLDKSLMHWDIGSVKKQESTCIDSFFSHQNYVLCVAISPNGQLVASGSKDHSIRFWDIRNATVLKVVHGHDESVSSVDFSAGIGLIATGSMDNKAKIWKYKMTT